MTTAQVDPMTKIAEELLWLQANPDFEERPATLAEFLGPDYLNIEEGVRERIRTELVEIMGEEVSGERMTKYALAIITGGIGIGKTTIASIVLPYLVHWVLCLKDPQAFFSLLPGSRIAFMQMSTSEKQALEVVFGDIKARISHSPWFLKYPYSPKFVNQLRFPKEVWIIPGDSAETTFEGYNILGGILDEADSHKITKNKDYAEQGFNTIDSRISSRFQDRGFLLVIGQMKSGTGFAARKYREFKNRPDAHATRLAIWDSMGDEFYRDKQTGELRKFAYDTYRKQILPLELAIALDNANLLFIPELYRRNFENNPETALRDLAGMPPVVGDPFISLTNRIYECRERWTARFPVLGGVGPVDERGRLAPWFHAPDTLKRAVHVDIAYAADGDALGIAMGHVREMVEIEGERKPHIVIDALIRMTAPAGGEIFLGDVRRTIYNLRDALGFRIKDVTLDGFQSQDTIQQLQKRRFHADYLSIDRQVLPYHDLREAIYEGRLDIPPYYVRLRHDDDQLTEIAMKELSELIDNGNKIDHPDKGSKDIADCLAGVVFTLMGDRNYRKNANLLEGLGGNPASMAVGGVGYNHPAVRVGSFTMPVAPSITESIQGIR